MQKCKTSSPKEWVWLTIFFHSSRYMLTSCDLSDLLVNSTLSLLSHHSSPAVQVASIVIDEEELRGPQPIPLTPTTPSHSTKALNTAVSRYRTDKSWEELIPSEDLQQMKAEEDQEEHLKLYLPPRQRNVKVV